MRTPTSFILTIVFFTSLFSYSGGNVGNGGDVMLCKKADGLFKAIELLDYYEAKTLRGMKIDLGSNKLTPIEKVQYALKRIEKFSPRRYLKYRDWAQKFFDESQFVGNANLVDVPDSEIPVFPDGCKLEQIAIQKTPTFPEDKRYLVNLDLWNLLDDDNKAGLILHEIIYREGIELGQTNSKGVRYFNSIISSLQIEQMTLDQFMNLISTVGFNSIEVGNIELTEVKFYPDGKIHYAHVVKGTLLINGKEIEIERLISYYPDGSVESTFLKSDVDFIINNQTLSFSKGWFDFHENGNLKEGYQLCAKNVKTIYKGPNYIIDFKCEHQSIVERALFYSNGNPKSADRVRVTLNSGYGQLKLTSADFDNEGQIIGGYIQGQGRNEYRIGNLIYDFSGSGFFVEFYSDGAIKEFMGNYVVKAPTKILVQNFLLQPSSGMHFYETGAIKMIQIYNQVLRRQDGTLQYFKGGHRVDLDSSGFVIDETPNLSIDLISLNQFSREEIQSAQKMCGFKLADQMWEQALPGSCNKLEKTEEIILREGHQYNDRGWTVENECKKDSHRMTFHIVEQNNLLSSIDKTYLRIAGSFPYLRYKMFTPDGEFDDIGNPIPGKTVSEFLVIEFPKNYESILKVFNSSTDKETKIKLDLNTYVACLKTELKF